MKMKCAGLLCVSGAALYYQRRGCLHGECCTISSSLEMHGFEEDYWELTVTEAAFSVLEYQNPFNIYFSSFLSCIRLGAVFGISWELKEQLIGIDSRGCLIKKSFSFTCNPSCFLLF
jgi:hypothetical protein